MVMVVVFEFGVMRCQPLRRALGVWHSQVGSIFVDAFPLIMYKSF